MIVFYILSCRKDRKIPFIIVFYILSCRKDRKIPFIIAMLMVTAVFLSFLFM